MASNEKMFGKELIEDANKIQGCHAFKNSQMFIGGCADLYIKTPDLPSAWVELKFIPLSMVSQKIRNNLQSTFPVRLTQLQRRFLDKVQMSGDLGGWALCVQWDRLVWRLYASGKIYLDEIFSREFIQERRRGEVWDIEKMLNVIRGG